MRSPRFSHLLEQLKNEETVVADARAQLEGLSAEEARLFVYNLLAQQLANILRTSPARLERDRPLTDLGIDSLMVVELLSAIEEKFHVQFGSMEIMGTSTLAQISDRILAKIEIGKGAQPVSSAIPVEQEVDSLSDQAVDKLLENLLAQEDKPQETL